MNKEAREKMNEWNKFYRGTTKKELFYIAYNLAMRIGEDDPSEAYKIIKIERLLNKDRI